MEVEYNLELAKMISSGKVNGGFILPRNEAKYEFKVLTFDRLVDGMPQGLGMYRSGPVDLITPFDLKTGKSHGYEIILDLYDFMKGEFVSYICDDGDLIIGILSGINSHNNYATVSCQVNCSTNSIEESKSFFPIQLVRRALDHEVSKFMSVITSKGYKLTKDNKLKKIDPEKMFSPFEKVLVRSAGEGWQADFFSKMKQGKYCTVSGRWIEDIRDILPYNEEVKHLLNQ